MADRFDSYGQSPVESTDYLDKTDEANEDNSLENEPAEDAPQPAANNMPFSGERYTFSDLTGKNRPGNTLFSLISVILAGLSVLFAFLQLSIFALILALLAAGSALFSRKRLGYFDTLAIVGLFLAVFGAIVSLFFLLLGFFAPPVAPSPTPDQTGTPAEGSGNHGVAVFTALLSHLRLLR